MSEIKKYIEIIREHLYKDYREMYREEGGTFKYPFLTPGSQQYSDVLWDWDSWLSNIALRQILSDINDVDESRYAKSYERGCILNYLSWGGKDGWIPIVVNRTTDIAKIKPQNIFRQNMHKPCLAQHSAFLVKQDGGDAEWLRDKFYFMQTFINNYNNHHKHRCGIYYWQTDMAVGGDNDPCTYFRPPGSSGSIYLNSLMYKELNAIAYLCNCLNLHEIGTQYENDALALKSSIIEHCWDERDGFFYSVDLNLMPNENIEFLHSGQPRSWECLIQRIGVRSGFMPLWAGIATHEQAERIVNEHYRNTKTFNAPFGIRTLSKMEKMYSLKASANPSNWLGPIWGISNYMTFRGLVKYGYIQDAYDLVEKTIRLFGRDLERFGALHEYYQPSNGEPILNKGFQNWNYLIINMIAWMEGKKIIEEF